MQRDRAISTLDLYIKLIPEPLSEIIAKNSKVKQKSDNKSQKRKKDDEDEAEGSESEYSYESIEYEQEVDEDEVAPKSSKVENIDPKLA